MAMTPEMEKEMSRELRMVPANWEHPKEWNPYRGEVYKPLLGYDFEESFNNWREHDMPEWLEHYDQWQVGKKWDYGDKKYKNIPEKYSGWSYEKYAGPCPASPDPNDYMPQWSDEEKTHYMMYETCSEGTPISGVFESKEKLCKWLEESGASAFGAETANYDWWLGVCNSNTSLIEIGNGIYAL